MTVRNAFFDFGFAVASVVDPGKKRVSNQDEVVICPDTGFFAVSDGMGGLPCGGQTSKMIQRELPGIIQSILHELLQPPSPEDAATLLAKAVRQLSDNIYFAGNRGLRYNYGATLSGVWLTGRHAVFVNLGDSRGYLLPRKERKIRQITEDHNVATELVKYGAITKEEARFHPKSAQVTRFAGMDARITPDILPDVFICDIKPGDLILLCSDGLHGMIDDVELSSLLRSSKYPLPVCKRLVTEANNNGGRDNIAVIVVRIEN